MKQKLHHLYSDLTDLISKIGMTVHDQKEINSILLHVCTDVPANVQLKPGRLKPIRRGAIRRTQIKRVLGSIMRIVRSILRYHKAKAAYGQCITILELYEFIKGRA